MLSLLTPLLMPKVVKMDDDGIRYRRGNAVSNDQGSVLREAEGSAKAEYEYKTRGGMSVRGL